MLTLLTLLVIGLTATAIQHFYNFKYASYFWFAYLAACGWVAVDLAGVDRDAMKALAVALTVVVGMGALEEYYKSKKRES